MKDWLRVTAIIAMVLTTMTSIADSDESASLRMFIISVDFYLLWVMCG